MSNQHPEWAENQGFRPILADDQDTAERTIDEIAEGAAPGELHDLARLREAAVLGLRGRVPLPDFQDPEDQTTSDDVLFQVGQALREGLSMPEPSETDETLSTDARERIWAQVAAAWDGPFSPITARSSAPFEGPPTETPPMSGDRPKRRG